MGRGGLSAQTIMRFAASSSGVRPIDSVTTTTSGSLKRQLRTPEATPTPKRTKANSPP